MLSSRCISGSDVHEFKAGKLFSKRQYISFTHHGKAFKLGGAT